MNKYKAVIWWSVNGGIASESKNVKAQTLYGAVDAVLKYNGGHPPNWEVIELNIRYISNE